VYQQGGGPQKSCGWDAIEALWGDGDAQEGMGLDSDELLTII